MEEEAGEDPRELNELVIERGTYLKKRGLLNITNLRSDPNREKDIEKRLTILRQKVKEREQGLEVQAPHELAKELLDSFTENFAKEQDQVR